MISQDRKTVFVFSGQGTQYRNMGLELFKHNEVFKKSIEYSDAIVKRLLNRSLIQELYYSSEKEFDDLLITNPAIIAVELAIYEVLKNIGIFSDFVTGTSLGEFSAAVVSEIWSAEMALEASIELAKSVSPFDNEGGMLTVIHNNDASIQNIYNKYSLFLAADNFAGNFTLSGLTGDLERFEQELNSLHIQFIRLPVRFPFHSGLIEKFKHSFKYFLLTSPDLSPPKKGFISGLECKQPDLLPQNYFWDAVCSYINFPRLITYIEYLGPCLYVDLGPSGTGITFVKYNLAPDSRSTGLQIMTPYKRELEQIEKLTQIVRLALKG